MLTIRHYRIPERDKREKDFNERETGTQEIVWSEPGDSETKRIREGKRASLEFPICLLYSEA
jgi:hypothetical protein